MGKDEPRGISHFGWCLPGVSTGSHDDCRGSFTYYDKLISCACLCHTDKQAFKEEQSGKRTTKQRRSKKVDGPSKHSDKQDGLSTTEVQKPSKRNRTATNKTSKGV